MIISATKLFETSSIQDPELQKNLEPLIAFTNNLADQLIRMSQKQITIADNLDAEYKIIQLTNSIEKEILIRNAERLLGVIPINAISTGVKDFKWRITSTGNVAVTIGLLDDIKTQCTILFLYK